jgi:tRNA (mo5U34)-methyltransferase
VAQEQRRQCVELAQASMGAPVPAFYGQAEAMQVDELLDEIARYPWYHTIDLGGGVVTRGMFDHRGSEDRYGIPSDLTGKRCLDVGTMDGFWAFTMERRGASEVVAVDIEDPEALDWPASLRHRIVKTMDETKATRFELAKRRIGSSVERYLSSVYALDPSEIGTFDFVFCGDMLVHLKDPPTAVERIRSVCRGVALIANPVKEQFPYRRRPLAQFDGVDEFEWWLPNRSALERMLRAAGFSRVVTGPPFALPTTSGGSWKGRRRWVRGEV